MRVAINGFGRIGRCILRAIYENNFNDFEVVAINSGSAPTKMDAHLLKYDSVHGVFPFDINFVDDSNLIVHGKNIKITHEKDVSKLDWNGIDVVFECTGKFLTREKAASHINAGAKKVLLSGPAKDKDIPTVVYKVNDNLISQEENVFSIGSCTTNCLAPVAYVLDKEFGINSGFVTTVHAYTNDQNIIDGSHKGDYRRARSAAVSMIPTSTGAAKAISAVIPSLSGKLDGAAVRVPVQNVSMIDLTCNLNKNVSVEDVNNTMKEASLHSMKGMLGYCDEPLVSIDFNHTNDSSVFDSMETRVVNGNFLRVLSWYDNEWSFAVRMLDIARKLI
ncbi:MAG: type glyceraldehyde-3-phosphate dehydrogenase [Pseudomonadota bacterium]|jgi:glyceraldehyde 3-phosphate dehydrogenase